MRVIDTMVGYKRWANQLFFESLQQLSRAQLIAPQPIVFGSLLQTMHHTYLMDRVWQANLLGQRHGMSARTSDQLPELGELYDNQAAMDAWYVEYTNNLVSEHESNEISFEFVGGENGVMEIKDILLHVVNHATYHRGNAEGVLYHYGVVPPTTDLPIYLAR